MNDKKKFSITRQFFRSSSDIIKFLGDVTKQKKVFMFVSFLSHYVSITSNANLFL
jgi:hypothetical protein